MTLDHLATLTEIELSRYASGAYGVHKRMEFYLLVHGLAKEELSRKSLGFLKGGKSR